MKTPIVLIAIASLAVLVGGCLLTGQIWIFQSVDTMATTNAVVTPVVVDLNKDGDYADNRGNIKSVDQIGFVADVTNNLSAPARVEIYISDDPNLVGVDQVKANATLVMVSPEVPANGKLHIGWSDGFDYIVNDKALIDQILGDGLFMTYAVAQDTPFSLVVQLEAVVVLTVGS